MESKKRKIMALGRSSLVISLPKVWLDLHGLDKGDEVSVDTQSDGSLIIQSLLYKRDRSREIHLAVETNETDQSIVRRIIGAFLDGYNLIKLSSEDVFSLEQQRAVREVAAKLYMMVLESEARSIVIQTLVDETQASVTSSIERMHIITYSMCRDILEALRNRNIELARSVLSLEGDVDQLAFLLLRLIRRFVIDPVLSRKLGLDALDGLEYQTIVNTIERIADHANSVAQSVIWIIENNITLPDEIFDVLTKAADIAFSSYDQAVQGYLSKNISQTNEIIDRKIRINELYSGITPLTMSAKPPVLSNIINIRESIRNVSHHASRIAELTIDRTYRINTD